MKNIGENLKLLMSKSGVTQKKLSEATGIPVRTIANITGTNKEPGISKVKVLADYFGVTLDWMMADHQDSELSWRVSDGGGKFSASPGSFSKRIRILYLHLQDEENLPDLNYWEECISRLQDLVEQARKNGFKEDVMWMLTGHNREQMLCNLLDSKIFEILKGLEGLPDTKQGIVKTLIDQLK